MIVCTQCGFSNEDSDAFCGDCGEFLEFVGQKVEAEGAEEPAADLDLVAEEAAAEEPVETMVEVNGAHVAAGSVPAEAAAAAEPSPAPPPEPPPASAAPAAAAPPPPAAEPEVVPATPSLRDRPAPAPAEPEVVPATPSLRDRPAPAPATTAGGTTPAPAASVAPPEAPPKPAAPTPAPAEPRAATPPPSTPAPAKPSTPGPSAPTAAPPPKPAARPQPAAATEPAKVQAGDKVCAECGAGNTPQRKFCRSCGTSLVAAAPPPVVEEKPPPKLIDKVSDRVTGKKELGPMAAGERPPPKKSKSNLTKPLVIGAVVVLGAAALLFRGALTDKASDIRQTVAPGFEPVNPNAAEATSEVAGHEALDATDTGSNTFWAEGAEGDGTGQAITIRFPAAFSLAKVGIFPGRGGEEFLVHPRPKDVHIELLDGAGASLGGRDATLEDKADLQLVDVSGEGVSAVRIEIRSVYPGQSGQEASITDLQFFTAT